MLFQSKSDSKEGITRVSPPVEDAVKESEIGYPTVSGPPAAVAAVPEQMNSKCAFVVVVVTKAFGAIS